MSLSTRTYTGPCLICSPDQFPGFRDPQHSLQQVFCDIGFWVILQPIQQPPKPGDTDVRDALGDDPVELKRARRLGAAEVTRSLGELLSLQWQPAQASMEETATLYNRLYAVAIEETTRSRHAMNDVEL